MTDRYDYKINVISADEEGHVYSMQNIFMIATDVSKSGFW